MIDPSHSVVHREKRSKNRRPRPSLSTISFDCREIIYRQECSDIHADRVDWSIVAHVVFHLREEFLSIVKSIEDVRQESIHRTRHRTENNSRSIERLRVVVWDYRIREESTKQILEEKHVNRVASPCFVRYSSSIPVHYNLHQSELHRFSCYRRECRWLVPLSNTRCSSTPPHVFAIWSQSVEFQLEEQQKHLLNALRLCCSGHSETWSNIDQEHFDVKDDLFECVEDFSQIDFWSSDIGEVRCQP